MKIAFYGNLLEDIKAVENHYKSDIIDDLFKTEVESYTLLDAQRGNDPHIVSELEQDYLIEVEYDNGIVDFLTPDEFKALGSSSASRGIEITPVDGEDVVWVNRTVAFDNAERGLKDFGIKIFKILRRKKLKKAKDMAAGVLIELVAERVDKKNIPNEGLFQCKAEAMQLGSKVVQATSSEDKPHLLLIHGFATSAEQTFAGMSAARSGWMWKQLQQKYHGHIWAYDHRTLTKSPLQNAAELLVSLPKGTTLDVLSSSRGGLVAEIFVKAAETARQEDKGDPFWQDLEDAFQEREKDLKYIQLIRSLSKEKDLKVRSLTRVACPAGGTTLASDRLVLYLKVLLNAIGLIPQVKVFPPYAHLKNFIIAIAEQKDNANTLPGIEALDVDSLYVKAINLLGSDYPITQIPLYVISGDVTWGSFGHSIKMIFADLFFLGKHDFVVDTKSMYQGFPRQIAPTDAADAEDMGKRGFLMSFHKDKDVSHFNYFRNEGSQQAICEALNGTASQSNLFQWYSNEEEEDDFFDDDARGQTFDPEKPTVIVIPGIMGSSLTVDNKNVWLSRKLFRNGMAKIKMGAGGVEPKNALKACYGPMAWYLRKTHNVVVHAFDWRLDLFETCDLLNKTVLDELAKTKKSVRFAAHSMGGLLVHAMYNKHKETWRSLKQREGFRAVFLGSPFRGSHAVVNLFLGKHSIFNILHSIDTGLNKEEMLGIVSEFYGMLQLLPAGLDEHDFTKLKFWKQLKTAIGDRPDLPLPNKNVLDKVAQLQAAFQADPIHGDELIYVAGKGDLTAHRLDIGNALSPPKVKATVKGDGTVPWKSGILPEFGNRVWYMEQSHMNMTALPWLFRGIAELLTSGETDSSRIQRQEPASRGEQLEYDMPNHKPVMVNNEKDLVRQLLGDEYQEDKQTPIIEIAAKVTHGDLGFAEFPVIVGHVEGSDLVGAEWAVNMQLKNALSQHHDLNAYPGKLEESLVILQERSLFKGAVVVGMGYNDRLTEAALEKTLTKGLIELAMQGLRDRKGRDPSTVYGISPLLIGSVYGGLETLSSLRAIVTAMTRVNDMFAEKGMPGIRPFTELQVIELYEDKAIQINKALIRLKQDAEFREILKVDRHVNLGTGGLVRLSQERESDWWHRLQITEERVTQRIENDMGVEETKETSYMKFISLSDRARAEVEMLATDRQMVDMLVASAVKLQKMDPAMAKTLYELMIPHDFKGYTDDLQNLTLVVDDKTANYPWELLNSTIDAREGPIATRIGFIRQLHDAHYRLQAYYTQENRALVIGDPVPTAPYKPLGYAKIEAEQVTSLLQSRFRMEVESSIQEGSEAVALKLFKNNYKVIHLSGHGEYDERDPSRSGMILSSGVRITPSVIAQMGSVPELVFINCCHLGKVDNDTREFTMANRNKLAANLGVQFIRNGVQAVIAAGWAVNDKAAAVFADEFYNSMFKGDDFGTAVLRARKLCFSQYPSSNTWAAYQCYGNPHYRISDKKSGGIRNEEPYVHVKELINDLENSALRGDSSSGRDREWRKGKIEAFLTKGKVWKDHVKVREAAAWAYFELYLYQQSLEHYEHVFIDNPHRAKIRSWGNYIKLLTVEAIRLNAKDAIANKAEIKRNLARADHFVQILLEIGIHPEAYTTAAGHCKRKISLAKSDEAFTNLLQESIEYYYKAYVEAHEGKQGNPMYALGNVLMLAEIQRLNLGKLKVSNSAYSKARAVELLNVGIDQRAAFKDRATDFWSVVHGADMAIAGMFINTDVKTERDFNKCVEEALRFVKLSWERGGSWRKLEAIQEHYVSLRDLLERIIESKNAKRGRLILITCAISSFVDGLNEVEQGDDRG